MIDNIPVEVSGFGVGKWIGDEGRKEHKDGYSDSDFDPIGQLLNILGFVSHTVSVTTTQLCCCNAKGTGGWLVFSQKTYSQTPKFEFQLILCVMR